LVTKSSSSKTHPRAHRVACHSKDDAEDELKVWREAYALEEDRADLLAASFESALEQLGDLSKELRLEFEGCLVDLEKAPAKPASDEAGMWSEAYLGIRRCNEQLELKIDEVKAKVSEKESEKSGDFQSLTHNMDIGPIRLKGITFKDMKFDRYNREKGSKFYFIELPMPLGVRLEPTEIQSGLRVGNAIQVAELVEGGSALGDGSIRVGDYLRAVTVVQRQMKMGMNDEGEEEEPELIDVVGVGAGQVTKSIHVFPEGFPLEEVTKEMTSNKRMDGYCGMVFERPFD